MAVPRPVSWQKLQFQLRLLPPNSRSVTSTAAVNARAAVHQSSHTSPSAPVTREFDSRWLSTIKGRLGKCLAFGLKSHQVNEAGEILQVLARDWRELTAGSEGFLTGVERRGLYRHNVVWGEMDVMGRALRSPAKPPCHVNNVAYVRYAETARVNWARNIGTHVDRANRRAWINLLGSTGVGLILKSIKIDYKFPMTAPDKISVYHKLSHPPPAPSSPESSSYSSFQLDVLILSEAHQRPAARCREDIVTYDYQLGRKVKTLPPFMMDQFRKTWELQEESRRTWGLKVKEIEDRVRGLETSSWDRPDAVEDMGSSG
ncbi:hypothetical protein BDBG_02256 [Blastomyces gilchristii SLH14081]|uniref:Thioesterase n=1 Tax=Blastomyces gilchristii (strain SLH14081) TaxID=559298 RepID=A0A179UFN3_BLAGS|nr:uncharacterized protein BDBG_02256 [Blastomyces gilchristii SLH14081]OAT05957.1 hypothetical protein BDBG_02256 [Blastomyces gilchristii SLH14081]